MIDHLHGISTFAQLRAGGLGRAGIAARVRRGELEHVRQNLYRHPFRKPDELQLAAIGQLSVEGTAYLTGACCLRARGYTVRFRRNHADLVVPYGAAVPDDDLKWIHYRRSSHLGAVVSQQVEGLAGVPDWWAFGDLAYDLQDAALAEVIAAAVGAGKITLEVLEDSLSRRGRFPGKKRLRRVLGALRSDLPFSRTEAKAAKALREAGMDVRLQHDVTTDGGRVLRLDIVLEDLKIDIEVDGPHHWLPLQSASDRQRDRMLRELDWLVERFSVYEIDKDMDAFVAEVVRIVERRRASLVDRRAA